MNLRMRIVYKNKELKPISKCEYSLEDYSDMLSMDLKRIITDVEDLIYTMNGNKPKDEWDENALCAFGKIKHKLLDKAGEVARLPENIFDAENDKDSISSFWNELFNEEE